MSSPKSSGVAAKKGWRKMRAFCSAMLDDGQEWPRLCELLRLHVFKWRDATALKSCLYCMFIEYYFERGKTATEQTTATYATCFRRLRFVWRLCKYIDLHHYITTNAFSILGKLSSFSMPPIICLSPTALQEAFDGPPFELHG